MISHLIFRQTRHNNQQSECGSLCIEFVIALPFFCILLLGMIEVGNYLFWSASLDSGSQQVARLLEATPSSQGKLSITDNQAKNALIKACPSFSGKEGLSLHLRQTSTQKSTYTHHLPASSNHTASEHTASYVDIQTTIEAEYAYPSLSFVGEVFKQSDGMIHVTRTITVHQALQLKDWAIIW